MDQTLQPQLILNPLFEKAKTVDEFEFCCAILRIRGIEGPYRDPFRESYELTQQLLGLIQAPIDGGLQIRLILFLYCHLTENDDIYNVVANLLLITTGKRCHITPFAALPKPSKKHPPGYRRSPRIDQQITLANDCGFQEVGSLFDEFFVRPVRNAFYHSDYILSPDSFNIKRGEGVNIKNNIIESSIPLEWLVPRLELGINAALALVELLFEHISSYREDKVVRGRIAPNGSWVDVQLTTKPGYGLTGFKSPPDAGLRGVPAGLPNSPTTQDPQGNSK